MIGDRYPAPGFATDLTDKNITLWFMEGMSDAVMNEDIIYNKIANIREMTSPTDVVATFSGGQLYGTHQPMEKARVYEPGSGWKIRMYPQIYKNAFIVPGTVMEWNAYQRFVEMQSKQLGAFGIITLDYVFVNMLNNGFDTAFPIYDGEPLFSTNHVLKNAPGVFANRPVNGSNITQESLGEGQLYFMSMPNDDGVRFSMRAAWLLITPNQFPKAMQVLGQTLDPNVNNNGTPTLTAGFSQFGGPPRVIVSSKLTDTDAWFLIADKGQLSGNGHGLDLYFTPEGYPTTETVMERDPKSEKHIGSFRVAPTITKARGIWGNPGPT